jgi:hypothetical protein
VGGWQSDEAPGAREALFFASVLCFCLAIVLFPLQMGFRFGGKGRASVLRIRPARFAL